jgi:hypothetical protein
VVVMVAMVPGATAVAMPVPPPPQQAVAVVKLGVSGTTAGSCGWRVPEGGLTELSAADRSRSGYHPDQLVRGGGCSPYRWGVPKWGAARSGVATCCGCTHRGGWMQQLAAGA